MLFEETTTKEATNFNQQLIEKDCLIDQLSSELKNKEAAAHSTDIALSALELKVLHI
jgi:hypothetical protein